MAFNEEQLAALKAKLERSVVKQRDQAGRKLSYIEGWHAIAEANRIFGFDAWDRETLELRLVSEKPRKIGKGQYEKDGFGVSYIAKVRIVVTAGGKVVLRDGTGYGSGIDADLGAAHESAIKEAETDAMKRALMTFGNPFGLALYDKEQSEVEHSGGNGKPAPAPAAKAPASRPAPPKKFDLLRENGELLAEVNDPNLWCQDLRRELEAPGAMVAALWKMNEPLAAVIRDHFPDVQWADRKGTKFPAYDFLAAIVRKLTPGIAA